MKTSQRFLAIISLLCAGVIVGIPIGARAETEELPDSAKVIITEIQTGRTARGDEFIELHNTTEAPLDLTGWQLRYVTASETSTKTVQDPTSIIRLVTPLVSGQPALVPAKGYHLLYAGAVSLPAGVIGQQYEGLLPATGGSLIVLSPDAAVCELVVEDALAWGDTVHLFGEGEALVPANTSPGDRLNVRYIRADSTYADTGANAADFLAIAAAALPYIGSPGAANTTPLPDLITPGSGVASQQLPARITDPDCALPPEPEPPVDPVPTPPNESPPSVTEPPADDPTESPKPTIPASNIGLKSPLLSEFLPNPASPQTDKNDEFIELYNANDASFDLSGYVLEVGLTTKRRFTIPPGTKISPVSFLAFFSSETKLALANSGSQISLLDPLGRVLVAGEAYATAKAGQAWVLADGKWQWTAKPTPGALNVISVPAVKKAEPKSPKPALLARSSAVKQQSATASPQEADDQDAASTASSPLHPGILALIAASALLYGAYEYRHDFKNKLHQFRSNRAARRAARQSAEGR